MLASPVIATDANRRVLYGLHPSFTPSLEFFEVIMQHYLLFYEAAPGYLEGRVQFRNEHLALAWQAHARGELILGGALTDPADGAVLLFQGDSLDVATRFAEADPYVLNGLIARWYVRPWLTVVGDQAATPVRVGD
jgi:uncharacterized protein